jgi:hypothetical protein
MFYVKMKYIVHALYILPTNFVLGDLKSENLILSWIYNLLTLKNVYYRYKYIWFKINVDIWLPT